MKFSKKDFDKKYKPKEVDELYDPNKGEIGGDTVITQSEVGTDTPVVPADKTTARKKGMSIDNQKFASQTRNTSADWGLSRFSMGVPYGNYSPVSEQEIKELAKEKMKKMIKELLQTRNDVSDLVNNKQYSDINRNNIPDLEEIGDIHLSKLADDVNKSLIDKDEDVIAAVLNDLVIKVKDKLSSDYKNIIKNNL
jgi:hypothetical protein